MRPTRLMGRANRVSVGLSRRPPLTTGPPPERCELFRFTITIYTILGADRGEEDYVIHPTRGSSATSICVTSRGFGSRALRVFCRLTLPH